MTYCIDCQELYDKASDPKPKRIHANFNIATKKTAKYCNTHKKEGMVDVRHAKCECGERANYSSISCKKCFVKNNPDVKPVNTNKKCQFENCPKHPNFNKIGEQGGVYCKPHALRVFGENNFENVVTKICECGKYVTGCKIHGNRKNRPVRAKRVGLYRSYEKIVSALALIPLHFPDHYTEELFDTAVKSVHTPNEARHPIVSIDGMKKIGEVLSEFRKRSPKKLQEDETRYAIFRDEIGKRLGHIVMSCKFAGINYGQCIYTCGFCGAKDQVSSIFHLQRSNATGRCNKCCNWLEYDDVCADFLENRNFTMVMTREEFYDAYKASSYQETAITVQCKCDAENIFTTTMDSLLKKGNGGRGGCDACTGERRAATNMDRYGVPHAIQNPDVFEKHGKNSLKYKLYTLPSGRSVHLQGYEYDALLCLLNGMYICGFDPMLMFTESNMLLSRREVGRVTYTFQDESHYYFPDFKIMDTDIFIEVKSTYTIFADLDVNLAKFKATCESGSRIVIMVLDGNKEDIHFAELDKTNIDTYISTMKRMEELRSQKIRMQTITDFKNWYDVL
jgi:hypothetical protein